MIAPPTPPCRLFRERLITTVPAAGSSIQQVDVIFGGHEHPGTPAIEWGQGSGFFLPPIAHTRIRRLRNGAGRPLLEPARNSRRQRGCCQGQRSCRQRSRRAPGGTSGRTAVVGPSTPSVQAKEAPLFTESSASDPLLTGNSDRSDAGRCLPGARASLHGNQGGLRPKLYRGSGTPARLPPCEPGGSEASCLLGALVWGVHCPVLTERVFAVFFPNLPFCPGLEYSSRVFK